MWISWDQLESLSIAQASTSKQEYWMIQAYQFFNKPVANSSIIVPMAHEMLKNHCAFQHGPTTFHGTNL